MFSVPREFVVNAEILDESRILRREDRRRPKNWARLL